MYPEDDQFSLLKSGMYYKMSKKYIFHNAIVWYPTIYFFPRMMEAIEVQFLANVEASPSYRQLVLGMAEEAAEKNVI